MDFSQKKGALDNPYSVIYQRKLDTAIRNSFLNVYLSQIKTKNITDDNRGLQNMTSHLGKIEEFERGPDYYPILLMKILNSKYALNSDKHSQSRESNNRIIKLITKSIEIQTMYLHDADSTFNRNQVLASFTNWSHGLTHPLEVRNLITTLQHLENILDLYNQLMAPDVQKLKNEDYFNKLNHIGHYEIPDLDLQLWWNRTLMVIKIDSQVWVQPRVAMLLCHNKICDLISVLVLSIAGQKSSLIDDAYNITIQFVKILAKIIIRYKNKGFGILKALEGLIIAETLKIEEDWNNHEFLSAITDELQEDIGFNYYESELCAALTSVDTPMRHELGCLSKIVGHPLVDMEGGSKKLHEKTTTGKLINPLKIQDCINFFKQDYIKKTVSSTGKWPPCELNSLNAPKPLQMAYIYNKDPDSLFIQRKFGRVKVEDYVFIDLKQNLAFQRLENIIPYLKDKTISMCRSKVWNAYINKIDPKIDWRETRLLLVYLLSPSMTTRHSDYLDKYINEDDLDRLYSYLCIRIVPKEKELKEKFRGFGCKTYEDRHRCLVQEKNVALFLEEYSDEQTMTISELTLLKRLDAFRRINKAYRGYVPLYVVIDSSSWNNAFSKMTVDVMMKETLDKIYNTPIFSKTHASYEKTLLYVPDVDECWYWEGQRGGIEGLNQYTWVVVYLSQIKVALREFGFKYHIACKGDDLRIVILIPENTYQEVNISRLKNHIVSHISAIMKEFGHTINIEESYSSSKYFAFSKSASLGLIELPQTFRKIQKAYGANNSFINTLDDYIASSFSNGHSACKTSPNIVPCYYTSLFWVYYYLTNSKLYGQLSDDHLLALSLIPSNVGGFPIIYLHNFHVRAESDLLSPFLGLMKFCEQNYYSVFQSMEKFCYTTLQPPKTYIGLYRDPYSIPLLSPPLPTAILRNEILPSLKRNTKNREVINLIRTAEGPEMEKIIECLDSARYKRAKPLSVLYSASPQGVLEGITRRFETGQSVLELLLLRSNKNRVVKILRKVINGEKRLQEWRFNNLQRRYHNKPCRTFTHIIVDCPTESADKVREFCWGHIIYDITMPPLQHQIRIKQPNDATITEWDNRNHFTYRILSYNDTISHDKREQYSIGEASPFIGYTTRSGTIDPVIHFVEKDCILQQVKALLDLLSWTNISYINPQTGDVENSNSLDIIRQLIKIYTEVPLEELAPFSAVRKSGTAQHHMRSPNFRESIVPNTLSNTYTRMTGESNSHVTLRTSHLHFRMNLLHIYCHTNLLIFNQLNFKKRLIVPEEIWCVTTPCNHCNRPIHELPLVFNQELINNIDLTLLSFISLPELSSKILKKSLEAAGEVVPMTSNPLGIITPLIATRGMLQDLMEKTYFDRLKMQDRFVHCNFTTEGMHILSILGGHSDTRVVGLTEIKRLDLDTVIDFLAEMIVYLWYVSLLKQSNTDFSTWIMTTPSNEVPWFTLINLIHQAGRLESVVRAFEVRASIPSAGCYYNVTAATRYISIAAINLYNYGVYEYGQSLIYLTHFQTDQIKTYLNNCIFGARKKLVFDIIDKSLLSRILREYDQDNNINTGPAVIMLVSGLICYMICIYDEDEITELSEQIFNHNVQSFDVCCEEHFDLDTLTMKLSDIIESIQDRNSIEPLLYYLLESLAKIHNEDITNSEYIVDLIYIHFDTVIDILTTRNINLTIYIICSNLSECIRVIREDVEELNDGLQNNSMSSNDQEFNIDIEEMRTLSTRFSHARLKGTHLTYCYSMERINGAINVFPHEDTMLHFATSERLILTIDVAYRVLGSGNKSASLLINILTSFGIRELPESHYYMCLNDGHGGFCSVINELTHNSRIIFHTNVQGQHFDSVPSACLNNTRNENEFVYDFLAEGYEDLTQLSTRKRICNFNNTINLITSDLEMDNYDIHEYDRVQQAVLILIKAKISYSGIFIIRVRTDYSNNLYKILSQCRTLADKIFLLHPRGMSTLKAAYIVGIGSYPTFKDPHCPLRDDRDFQLFRDDDSNNRASRILNNIQRLYNQRLHSFTSKTISLYNTRTDHLSFYRGYLGNYGLSLITKHLGIIWNKVETIGHIFDLVQTEECRKPINELLIKHGFNIKANISNIKSRLRYDIIDVRSQSWDPNTKAHRSYLLIRLFKFYGSEFILETAGERLLTLGFNLNSALNLFDKLYQKLDYRDKNIFPRVHDLPATLIHAETWDVLYDAFLLGTKITICFITSYLSGSISRKAITRGQKPAELMEESD